MQNGMQYLKLEAGVILAIRVSRLRQIYAGICWRNMKEVIADRVSCGKECDRCQGC